VSVNVAGHASEHRVAERSCRGFDFGVAHARQPHPFGKIHADPRWQPFLRKVGKAPEQLAKIEFKGTLPQGVA